MYYLTKENEIRKYYQANKIQCSWSTVEWKIWTDGKIERNKVLPNKRDFVIVFGIISMYVFITFMQNQALMLYGIMFCKFFAEFGDKYLENISD